MIFRIIVTRTGNVKQFESMIHSTDLTNRAILIRVSILYIANNINAECSTGVIIA